MAATNDWARPVRGRKWYAESVARALVREREHRAHIAERIETALANGWSLNALAAELAEVAPEVAVTRQALQQRLRGVER